ncbi:MAG: GTPase, partial [Solirubrobacterales bacterium]|nr:GTPase [Solirubrobacterales bacterium]
LERLGAGRIDGGIGTRGPGESQIETDRRLARDRITALRRRLKRLEQTRGVQRSERTRAALPTIALAGYTNAGKSSLLNALTGAEVGVNNRLFETLDPTTRIFEYDGRRHLLTDTVGFISKLPHQLVDAFKATLEETTLADLILQVVDASEDDAARFEAIAAADAALEEIGAGESPRLLALNKIDLLDAGARMEASLRHPDAVLVSAETGEGLEELARRLSETVTSQLREVELLVPYEDGRRLSELHRVAGDLEREDRAEGVLVRARLPGEIAERFADLAVNGRS